MELGQVICKGEYGSIHLIKDKPNHIAKSQSKSSRVTNEVNILKQLHDCPGVVKLVEVIEHEYKVYMVMVKYEFDLYTYLDDYHFRGLPHRIAQTCLLQLLSALEYCHERKIIHRDIKSCNILVNDDDDDCVTMVLCDFGISRQVLNPNRTMTLNVISLNYRPPEILLRQDARYTEKVDVWSMGCVYAEMLNGWPLFNGDEVENICKEIKSFSSQQDQVHPHVFPSHEEYTLWKQGMMNDDSDKRFSAKQSIEGWTSLI